MTMEGFQLQDVKNEHNIEFVAGAMTITCPSNGAFFVQVYNYYYV